MEKQSFSAFYVSPEAQESSVRMSLNEAEVSIPLQLQLDSSHETEAFVQSKANPPPVVSSSQISPPSGTTLSSIFSLLNTTMGIGILSLPYALRSGGFLFGLVLMLVTTFLTNITHRFLISTSDYTGEFQFKKLASLSAGPVLGMIVEGTIVLYALGSCIAFMCILGSVITEVFEKWFSASSLLTQRWFVLPLLMIFVVFPLSAQRSLYKLRHSSFLALFCLFYLLFVVLERYFQVYRVGDMTSSSSSSSNSDSIEYFVADDVGLFISMPLITVSLCSQYNLLNIYGELKNRSFDRMTTISNMSCLICFVTYFAFASFGYLSFGGGTKADILDCYPSNDVLLISGRILQAVTLCLCYPIVFFALRRGLVNLFCEGTETSYAMLLLVTGVFSVLHTCIGIVVSDLSVVLSFSGSLFGGSIAFIYPCVLYLRLRKDRKMYHYTKLAAIAIVFIGVLFIVLGLVSAILNLV